MKLTAKNYHSAESNQAYWSASLFKSFLSCPARAMAELNGEWNPAPSTALLIGSFVDAAFESDNAFNAFVSGHPEMYKRDGTLKAEYAKAWDMINRAKQDPVFMEYMSGRHQVIKTGTIDGIPFKAKFDVLKTGKRIVDLKTVQDLKPKYKPEQGKMTPIEFWGWDIQMALYSAIEGHDLPTYLAIITKESPPDIQIVEIEKSDRDACLEFIKEKLPYFDAIKQGIIEPDRCENCEYCRATRKLTGPISLSELRMSSYE